MTYEGIMAIQRYYALNEWPIEPDETLYYERASVCIFCESSHKEYKQVVPEYDLFMCQKCGDFHTMLEEQTNMTIIYDGDRVTAYFVLNGPDWGWSYLVECPQERFIYDEDEDGPRRLFPTPRVALIEGLDTLLDIRQKS
jgi:hypothetical protein